MEYELFPYQVEGAGWLTRNPLALLADQMGIGKSAQVVRACDQLRLEKILVLTPAVGRENWLREFAKFSSRRLPARVLRRASRDELGPGITVCSYDLELMSYINTFSDGRYDALILDEEHFLKSTDAKRTRIVFGKNGLVRISDRVWALSGTPAPNHAGELWVLLYSFGRISLSYEAFVREFCEVRETTYGMQISGTRTDKIQELKALLAPIMLRRKKEDVLKDLPPITYGDLVVEPGKIDYETDFSFSSYCTPVDRLSELKAKIEAERQLVQTVSDRHGFGQDALQAFEAIASSVSTLRRYNGLLKVDGVAELVLGELEANAYEKIVIFAIHQNVVEGIRSKLSKFHPVTLYGKTPPEKREENQRKFNQKGGKHRVFIGNIYACGTNINLTAAHHVLFAEQDWVPGNNAQAAMRCHRIGQENPVSVRFVGLANSLDERLAQVLRKKTRELTAIFDE